MKVLTVRQPWATAIVSLGKNVENRTRNIAGSYRGPVAIHAAKREASPYDIAAGAIFDITGAYVLASDKGAIIGVVDLVDVHWSGMECSRPGAPTCHEYEQCSLWGMPYHHHLALKNPRALATPIPYQGALGLRELDAITEAAIWEQVALAAIRCPECETGKHGNCGGEALDIATDRIVPCPCATDNHVEVTV